MLLLVLAAWLVLLQVISRCAIKNQALWFATISLTLYGVLIGIANGSSVYDAAVNARDFMLPFVFYLIIGNLPLISRQGNALSVMLLIVFLSVHGMVSLYNYFTFNGSPESIWIYDILSDIDKGVSFGVANYIRDDQLRAMGLFVSPIEYSLTMLFGLFLSTFYFILGRCRLIKFWSILLIITFCSFLLVSNVRIWIVCYLIGMVTVYLVYKARKISRKKTYFILVPVSFVIASFLNIIFDFGFNDLSSIGRLDQYTSVLEMMIEKPLGLGFGDIGSKGSFSADSALLTSLMAFGWFFICLYLYMVLHIFMKVIQFINSISYNSTNNLHFRVLFFSLIAYCAAYLYTFFFHEGIFYNFQYLLFMFLALVTNKFGNELMTQKKSDRLLKGWEDQHGEGETNSLLWMGGKQ